MGKGDQRSKRGKIFAGSFGKTRPRKRHKKEAPGVAVAAKPEPAAKKKAPSPAE
jgi:30S ribosomal protein S31